jgi:3-methyladenine DNA glycosylase AlkD
MKLKEAMAALAAAGDERTRKTYARHGVKRAMYGVSYGALEKLRKAIKVDQELAVQLWNTGNHDARILATMVADPAQVSTRTLAPWMEELDHSLLVCAVSKLAGKTSSALECFKQWSQSNNDRISASGWAVLAELAADYPELPDSFFERQLKTIERDIHKAKNETKYMMNGALIAVGIRSPKLERLAFKAAERIGKVEVDHGDTACKTPDAAAYIKKTVARKKM